MKDTKMAGPLSDKSGGVFSEDNTLYERDITNASVGRY